VPQRSGGPSARMAAAARDMGLSPPIPCAECLTHGTEAPEHWGAVSGSWVVHRTEGDVDGVLGLVGYGPMARAAFRVGQYGRGVSRIDITMHGPRQVTLSFGGGPMPTTTNVLSIDGVEQEFKGNEGIPGDDRYRIAMWWEGEQMVAWGEHESGRYPRMHTRRYLSGARRDELVIERVVAGVASKMIYARCG